MKVLFVGYWGFYEGLTQATILPHLRVLSSFDHISKITFISIERTHDAKKFHLNVLKCIHVPLYSKNFRFGILNKLHDFVVFPKLMRQIVKNEKIDFVICRGAPAGALGYLLWRKSRIPYLVESFEPHAEYMLEGNVWSSYDPRYLLQGYFEKKQKQTASGLMPVSYNYERYLKSIEKLDCPIETMPCSVNIDKFKFDIQSRKSIRKKYHIDEETIVGIYVGKFGDIYYEDEAFLFFKSCFKHIDNFFLMLLCPQNVKYLNLKLAEVGFPIEKCWKGTVVHEDVAKYLSVADFAFSLHKRTEYSFAFSPIKNGEYWACGLPVIIPDGIGDDSQILKDTGLGIVIEDLGHPEKYFAQLATLIKANKQEEIRQLAVKYRNEENARNAYRKLIG